MWLHRFTHYLLRYPLRALALTFLITLVPILGMLSILIAALITVMKGAREGAAFTAAVIMGFLIKFCATYHHAAMPLLYYWAALGATILGDALTWAFAVMLYRKASWSTVVQVAALFGVLVVSVLHLVYPDIANWWGHQLLSSYHEQAALGATLLPGPIAKPSDMQLEMIQDAKQYVTGIMAAAILFNTIMQLILVRWWQYRVFAPISLHKELHHIRLSPLASMLFILSLLLSYLGNSVVLDMMPVLYLLFATAGLSLIHYLFSLMRSPTRWFWVLIFYVTLIFTVLLSCKVLALLGLIDSWVDIRKRWKI